MFEWYSLNEITDIKYNRALLHDSHIILFYSSSQDFYNVHLIKK